MNVNDSQQNGPEDPPAADEPTQPASPKRLVRVRDNRVFAGVCGGLGRYFGVDPILFRIGAVALTFVGGAGLLLIAGVVVLLLVAWPFLLGGGLLIAGIGIPLAILVGVGVLVWWIVSGEGPSGEAGDIARRAALGIGVLLVCGIVGLGGFIVAAAGPAWLVPTIIIVAGAAIAAGAFLKPVRWLVLPAVTLAISAGVVAAAGIELDGGVGQREYRPASTADIRDDYKLGVGQLVVDLRDTDLPPGDVPLEMDVGVGEARLIVPEDVCVATTADVGMGNVHVFGRDNGGIDVEFDDHERADADITRLLLDAQVGMGEVRVHDQQSEFDLADPGFDEDEFDPIGTGNAACAVRASTGADG
jgi:phage shock protein PspC (stress-responsive transcriptional regulator)